MVAPADTAWAAPLQPPSAKYLLSRHSPYMDLQHPSPGRATGTVPMVQLGTACTESVPRASPKKAHPAPQPLPALSTVPTRLEQLAGCRTPSGGGCSRQRVPTPKFTSRSSRPGTALPSPPPAQSLESGFGGSPRTRRGWAGEQGPWAEHGEPAAWRCIQPCPAAGDTGVVRVGCAGSGATDHAALEQRWGGRAGQGADGMHVCTHLHALHACTHTRMHTPACTHTHALAHVCTRPRANTPRQGGREAEQKEKTRYTL